MAASTSCTRVAVTAKSSHTASRRQARTKTTGKAAGDTASIPRKWLDGAGYSTLSVSRQLDQLDGPCKIVSIEMGLGCESTATLVARLMYRSALVPFLPLVPPICKAFCRSQPRLGSCCSSIARIPGSMSTVKSVIGSQMVALMVASKQASQLAFQQAFRAASNRASRGAFSFELKICR